MSFPISFTPAAIEKIKGLLQQENDPDCGLRVYLTGNSSSIQYGFIFDTLYSPDDVVVQIGGFNVFIDSLSAPYISGATIDYVYNAGDEGFMVTNSNMSQQYAVQ